MTRKLTISFGLVNIPVKIHNATKEAKVSFNQITPEHTYTDEEGKEIKCGGTRVKQFLRCERCGSEVNRATLKKGYEIAKDNYVVLTKEEVQAVRLPSAKSVVVEGFISSEELDPLLLADTFYVAPDDGGEGAYSLLADALGLLQKVAIGKVILNGKEQIVAIRRWRKLLLLSLLWYPYEIRTPPEVQLREVSERERELAKALIEACGSPDLKKFKDRYLEALKELIKAKVEGREIKPVEEAVPTEVGGIADALEASLKQVKAQVA